VLNLLINSLLEGISKIANEAEIKQVLTKQHSLHAVNEPFESQFNAVSSTAAFLR